MTRTIKTQEKVKVCDWYGKVYPYIVKTKGKHPVHMIDGGNYLTLDDRNFGVNDMGWYYLNERDWQYFINNQIEIDYNKLI